MVDTRTLLDDLLAEGDEVDALVSGPGADHWHHPTPAPGWTVAHQVAHLAWTDAQALLAATDPGAFARVLARAAANPAHLADIEAAHGAEQPREQLLAAWRTGRAALDEALAAVAPGGRMPWFGPPMGTASMATGRLMEYWAHGQDIADALGVTRTPTARLRHVARMGVRARDYAYAVRGEQPPAGEFRVELTAPDGDTWAWGPDDAPGRVTGPALDFCLLATRRRHRDDLALKAHGADADHWLDIAQTFAGPAGDGRTPGQFS
ncbi:TIGR03084 family metal-binding protein [Streptacidiphilus griseoplanus]|uniref:TIGR03084 family metal-binding protein n=1 Tax=Peterkaempfera griseoplana TaxID=66896 RepID=UPI0006E130CA|nr:TIGR03084 family metal-binding protein [Peterkaempfera griseoplana]